MVFGALGILGCVEAASFKLISCKESWAQQHETAHRGSMKRQLRSDRHLIGSWHGGQKINC